MTRISTISDDSASEDTNTNRQATASDTSAIAIVSAVITSESVKQAEEDKVKDASVPKTRQTSNSKINRTNTEVFP